MICYLSRNYKGVNNAANKAKTDIEYIMAIVMSGLSRPVIQMLS